MSTWREKAAPIIAQVIKDTGYDDIGRLKRAIYDAYPFGERARFPYKIWNDEVRRQTNGRLSRHGPKPVKNKKRGTAPRDTRAGDLFQ